MVLAETAYFMASSAVLLDAGRNEASGVSGVEVNRIDTLQQFSALRPEGWLHAL